MRYAYTLLHYLAMPLVLLRLVWRGLRNRGYWRGWSQRFGWCAPSPDSSSAYGPIWIHAVSVGEVQAAIPLARALLDQDPSRLFLMTTTTPTGRRRVIDGAGPSVRHCYVPYDLPGSVRRFLQRTRPRLAIIMETELWPNLLHACRRDSVPVLLANVRMSERSAQRYAWVPALTHEMLSNVSWIAPQTEADALRLVEMGAQGDRLRICGNIKFDVDIPAGLPVEAERLRRSWGARRRVWIAASTHHGEEEQVLDAFAQVRRTFPDCLLLLVPRHPERFQAMAALCRTRGYAVRMRSDRPPPPSETSLDCDIFVGDTMGELGLFYAASEVAFVGGSLMPIGGHNALEPAALGCPVLNGPHVFNFVDIDRRLIEIGAARRVDTAAELATAVVHWLTDEDARRAAGERARDFVEANRGAVGRIVALARESMSQ